MKRNEKFEVDWKILKCDYIRFSPSVSTTINTADSQISTNIPRKDCVSSPLNSYRDMNFDVLQAATNNRYADGDDIRLVNPGRFALFSDY